MIIDSFRFSGPSGPFSIFQSDFESDPPDDQSTNNHSITVVNNAIITSDQAKFGSFSLNLGGSGSYLSIADSPLFDLGVGGNPFTIEGFFYTSDLSAKAAPFFSRGSGLGGWGSENGHHFIFPLIESDLLHLNWWTGSGIGDVGIPISSTTLAVDTWNHIAICYDGSDLCLYANGDRVILETTTIEKPTNANLFFLGETTSVDAGTSCYVDSVRILDEAIYSGATITVPSGPFGIP